MDLTWIMFSVASRITRWKVDQRLLAEQSDHACIAMMIRATAGPEVGKRKTAWNAEHPRWTLRKLDADALQAITIALTWAQRTSYTDVSNEVRDISGIIARISDASTSRCCAAPTCLAY